MTAIIPPEYLEKLRKRGEANQTKINIATAFEGMTKEEMEATIKRITEAVDQAMRRHHKRPKKYIKIEGVEL